MNNDEHFAAWFNERRQQFVAYAANRGVPACDAEDVVQNAFVKVARHVHAGKMVNEGYVRRSIATLSIDFIRKERRRSLREQQYSRVPGENTGDSVENDLSSEILFPYLEASLSRLSPWQRSDFIARAHQDQSYSEIAQDTGRSEDAIRQSFRTARKNLGRLTIGEALRAGDFSALNGPRITEEVAKRIAGDLRGDFTALENLREVFAYKDLNRAVQNATWILIGLYPRRSPEAKTCADFLSQQLIQGDLYRGNKSYIAEALIDFDYRSYIQQVRKHFILPLEDFADRVTKENLDREEKSEVLRPCIWDLKKVTPIGGQLLRREVQGMEKRYLSGHGSIDARRCMAFQLLRCHPDNPQNAKSVTQFLREDPDQTNAYYVVRYLMNWGRVEHPELMNGETLDAIGCARDRWPSNHFLRNAHRRLSERLLKSA